LITSLMLTPIIWQPESVITYYDCGRG
jgi:hypothetical protein